MKKILYSILIAGLALASASCQKVEEKTVNPDNTDGQSTSPALTVTGSIVNFDATKVAYSLEDEEGNKGPKAGIKASWEIGDQIFGFDNGTGDNKSYFTFTVKEIKDGKAIFYNTSEYKQKQGVKKLYAIYYPQGNTTHFLNVSLAAQTGILGKETPAIMCATAEIKNDCVNFQFENQTAIVGIYLMQIKDDNGPVKNKRITGITLNNVATEGTFTLNNGFRLIPKPETILGSISATDLVLTTDENGYIAVSQDAIKPYFAVIPGEFDISITATDGKYIYECGKIGKNDIGKGMYYYLGKKITRVNVAEIDGTKYGTIGDAFDAVENGQTISLLQDCEFDKEVTLNDKSGTITLDLNGKTLTNVGNNRINLNNKDVTLTIEGGEESGADKDGTITSNNPNLAVIKVTAGNLIVNSGEIAVYKPADGVTATKSAIWVEGTESASVTVDGGKITGDSEKKISGNDGRCYALYVENEKASVNITSGTFSAQSNTLRINDASSVNISGGSFTSSHTGEYTIRLAGEYTCNISGEMTKVSGESSPVHVSSGNIILNVYNGLYSTTGSNMISRASGNNSSISVFGGFFNKEVNKDFVAPGYKCDKNPETQTDYSYIVKKDVEGKILVNGEGIATWADAVDAVNSSTTDATITLLENIKISGDYETIKNESNKVTTLNLNGYEITRQGNYTRTIYAETDLVIEDSRSGGSIIGCHSAIYVSGAKLTLNGGSFRGDGYASGGTAVVMVAASGSELIINDGTITCTGSQNAGRAINTNSTSVKINGGKINCDSENGYTIRAYDSADVEIDGNVSVYSNSSTAPLYSAATNAKIKFKNGYVYSQGEIINNKNRVVVTGGYFNKTVNAADGYRCVECSPVTGPDGKSYNYQVQSPIAKVTVGSTSTNYYSFEEALKFAKNANEDATVELQSDVELFNSTDFTNVNKQTIILDLNGKALSSTGVRNMITTTGELKITNTSETKGMITGTVNRIIYLTTAGEISVSNIIIETASTNYNTTIDSSAIVVHGTSSSANKAKFSASQTEIRTAAGKRTSLMAVYYGSLNLEKCVITESSTGSGYYALKTSSGAKVTISETSMYTPSYSNIHCMGATNAEIKVTDSWFYSENGTTNFSTSSGYTYDRVITASQCLFNRDIVTNPGNWKTENEETKKAIDPKEEHKHQDDLKLEYGYACRK